MFWLPVACVHPVELTQLATITVAGTLNAGLNLASSASPICEGSSTFIRVLLSETGVNYQLRNDADDSNVGTAVAGNGGTINLPTGNIFVTTTYNVVASNGTCSIELTDTETVNINPTPDVTLAVAASSALICSGTATSIVITGSESGVSYQLRNNADNSNIGSAVAGTGGNISLPTGNLTASMTFNVFAIAGSCSAQLTATASIAIRLARTLPVAELVEQIVQTSVRSYLPSLRSQAVMTVMRERFHLPLAEVMRRLPHLE